MLQQLRPWTKGQGEFVDTVIGIPESRTELVMLRPPDGGAGVELASYVRPDHEPGSPTAMRGPEGIVVALTGRIT